MKILVQPLTLKPIIMSLDNVIKLYNLDEDDIHLLKNDGTVWSDGTALNLADSLEN